MDVAKALERAELNAQLGTWMAIHGYLCLALRHPGVRGESRPMVLDFVHKLGRILVGTGVLTEEELFYAEKTEEIESPHGSH